MEQKKFEDLVKSIKDLNHPIFKSNDLEFSYIDGVKKGEILSDNLLQANPELYSIGKTPTEGQTKLLEKYGKKLETQIEPKLKQILSGIVDNLDQKGFKPQTSVRTKSPEGIHNKITRMIDGNSNKLGRPEYNLSKMPDAVGGRITVENIDDLSSVIAEIEGIFGKGGIIEKDSFYSNLDKINKPYRLVTYTVLTDGVPCEIQISTLNSSLVGDLDHNVVYKSHIMQATDAQKDYVKGISRTGNAIDLQNLKK